MPTPSPLHIATQSVQRLVKEEAYYHKELDTQRGRVSKLEESLKNGTTADADDNAEYVLKQEVSCVACLKQCGIRRYEKMLILLLRDLL
jgi:tubulin-specific chaperone A